MAKPQRQMVYERLLPYAEKNLTRISVEAGDYMGNKKCHHNARQRVETGEYEKVVACLSFLPRNGAYLHFVNKKGEKHYVDNTLGYLSQFNTYFFISEFTLDELRKLDTHKSCMYDMLPKLQDEFLSKVFSKKELNDLDINRGHI